MNEKQKTKLSKFLSLVLRHTPETIGLGLDENGWADVSANGVWLTDEVPPKFLKLL